MADHSARARGLILGSLRDVVRSIDERVPPDQALELLDWFVELERVAAAGKTLAVGRAATGEPWRQTGDRSAADWLARRSDTTIGDARTVLHTAAHLDAAPATAARFRDGDLPVAKAEAIVTAVAAAPDAEDRLLHAARNGTLKRVRDEAARVRAAADPDPDATHARLHATRTWRRWTDADGARCGTYRLTPEAAAILEAAAQPFIDTAIDHARTSATNDSYDALAADGLVAMAFHQLNPGNDNRDTSSDGDSDSNDGAGGVASGPRPPRGGRGRKRLRARGELIAIVNLAALQRGHLDDDETCEIAGVGPVPITVARDVFGDALLRIVIRDGVDIRTVVHTGRTASAIQETAILVRSSGICEHARCDTPAVEIDHRDGYATTGPVTLDQLLATCGPHHDQKSHHGATWHREPDGTITWTRPDGTQERERPPP